MREILFRGKAKSGDWKYGCLVKMFDEIGIIPADNENEFNPAIPQTIGQFIGETETLRDDKGHLKSGNKIFGGDILEVYSSEWEDSALYLVYWNDDSLGWRRKHLRGPRISDDEIDSIKIVGNIYDNPELTNS